jgi:hypothetical protein
VKAWCLVAGRCLLVVVCTMCTLLNAYSVLNNVVFIDSIANLSLFFLAYFVERTLCFFCAVIYEVRYCYSNYFR